MSFRYRLGRFDLSRRVELTRWGQTGGTIDQPRSRVMYDDRGTVGSTSGCRSFVLVVIDFLRVGRFGQARGGGGSIGLIGYGPLSGW